MEVYESLIIMCKISDHRSQGFGIPDMILFLGDAFPEEFEFMPD